MPSWFEFILLVLASFRLTRLIVYDSITEFLRSPFHQAVEDQLPDGTTETYVIIKGRGIRYWIGELLSCHWCTGIWSTVFIYVSFILWPVIVSPIVTILAIAGSASILQNMIDKD